MVIRPVRVVLLLFWGTCGFQNLAGGAPEPVVYRNVAFDFCFTLPADWSGYSIVNDEWKGQWIGEGSRPASGPPLEGVEILIRHPKWTSSAPREDIPIMIFSIAQWKLVAAEEVGVSAAPIGPAGLGRNAKYVFALPPRYSFDEKEGVEEVVDLMNHHPLRAPCPAATRR